METINKMLNLKNSVFVVVFLLSIFFILFSNKNIKIVKIAGQDIKVELAIARGDQISGLSGRESMPVDTGMLFIFPTPSKHHFWMKDMKFNLDMIWIDEDLNVVYIKENASPFYFPESYGPEIDCKYVLELNAGFVKKYNLKIGDKVEFVR